MANKRGGLTRIGQKATPNSSGYGAQRTVYTGGPARKLQTSIYGKTPDTTITKNASAMSGGTTRDCHLIGKRD